jgi:hypothetical protein
MSSFDSIKEGTEKAVSFVEWLAEVLRSRNWVSLLMLLGVLALFLNPWSLATLLGFILPGTPLPAGYAWVFGTAVGLTFIVAVIVAYRTVPRKSERAAVLVEPKAIKGLRPFGFEDDAISLGDRLVGESEVPELSATLRRFVDLVVGVLAQCQNGMSSSSSNCRTATNKRIAAPQPRTTRATISRCDIAPSVDLSKRPVERRALRLPALVLETGYFRIM